MKLSIVLATRNEESNIYNCLFAIKSIADEIIIFDEHSTDKTIEIARKFGASVFDTNHNDNFHVTKQKAINKAKGEWILQLDADEIVTKQLSNEISEVIKMTNEEIHNRVPKNKKDALLFERHLALLNKRDGQPKNNFGEVVAFFIPRVNMFLGKPLIHGGVYPDGVIRLIKNGRAHLPAKSVHEQMQINGAVAWLYNPLEHWDSPTLMRYIMRLNRYTSLQSVDISKKGVSKSLLNLIRYSSFEPAKVFIDRFVVHRGYLDGMYGFIWALFSAWHYPIAYYKFFVNTP